MSRATSLISRIGVVLRRVDPVSRSVYKRIVDRKGGDSLLGIVGSVEYTDILLDPPPTYQRVGRSLVGDSVIAESISNGDTTSIANEYQLTVSSSAISATEFSNPNLLIVFKDSNNQEEVFRVTDFDSVPFQGVDIIIVAFIRSTQRPVS